MENNNECKMCGYKWNSRTSSPKECPHCKSRLWYKGKCVRYDDKAVNHRYVKKFAPHEFRLEELAKFWISQFDTKWSFEGPSSYYYAWSVRDREALKQIYFELQNDFEKVKDIMVKAINDKSSGYKLAFLVEDWRKYARTVEPKYQSKPVESGRKLRDKNSY